MLGEEEEEGGRGGRGGGGGGGQETEWVEALLGPAKHCQALRSPAMPVRRGGRRRRRGFEKKKRFRTFQIPFKKAIDSGRFSTPRVGGVHLGDFPAIVKPRDRKVRPWGVRVLDVVEVEI